MLNTPFGLVASGDLYLDFLTPAGVSTGFQLAGNCKKFAPKVETETKENKANGRDTFGQTTESFTRITGSSLSMTFNRYDPAILAAAFMGTAVDQTAAAGAYTASITGIKDRWVETGSVGLDTCVVKDATDTTTYVAGTDYEINKRTGMIKVLTTDLNGDTLHITGNTLAKAGSKITAGTQSVVNVALRLDGKNLATGADVLVTVWQAQLRSETDFDFMGEDFPELTFTATLVTPSGKSSPFEVV
jgi:hypothetical protein